MCSWKKNGLTAILLVILALSFLAMYSGFNASGSGIDSSIKYLFVVEFSHLDIGFTAPPDELEEFYKTLIDKVISYCNTCPYYRWTVESIWQLEKWMERSSPSEINQFFNLVKEGRISIMGGYANMHTGAMGHEEINRFLYPAEKLRKEWNISIETVIQNDVPGYSWDLPQVLAKSGIKYMVTGINAWLGGGTSIPMRDIPFYWQGPDGSKVLTWISFDAYVEGFTTYGLTDLQNAYQKLSEKLPELENAGYPYDAVLVLRALDNGDANLNMVQLAIQWNNTYDNPKIVIATPEMFFHYIEKKYGDNFSVYSGDWAGLWDMLSITQPQSVAKNRWAHDNVITAEKISSINTLFGTQAYRLEDFNLIYKKMMEFDEHNTGGAPWPGLMTQEEAERQNRILCGYADTAYNMTVTILQSGLKSLASKIKTDGPSIIVFNPLSWNRTDIARLKLSEHFDPKIPFNIVDPETGKYVDYQIDLSKRELLFVAENVPALGYKRYDINLGFPKDPDSVYVNGTTIGNQFYEVTIDETDGHITSIYDKEAKRELVNPSSKFGFKFNKAIKCTKDQYLSGAYSYVPTGTCQISVGLNGPVAKSLIIKREGSPHIETEIILYSSIKRIDIINVMNRSLMQHVPYDIGYTFYMYTFPFNLSNYEVKLEIANTFMTPEENNLPDAAIPCFTIQHGLAITEPNYTLTWATKETFVYYFGQIQWYATTFNPPEPTIIVNFLKKEDEAQYKGGNIGPLEQEPGESPILIQSFSITTYPGSFDPVNTAHFIWEFSNPLLALPSLRRPYGDLEKPSASFFSVNSSNVMILAVKKADFGEGYIIRLLEISGTNATISISSYLPIIQAKLTNMTEEDIEDLTIESEKAIINVKSFETVTIRVIFGEQL